MGGLPLDLSRRRPARLPEPARAQRARQPQRAVEHGAHLGQQGDYALRIIAHCRANGYTSIEARADAAAAWTAHSLELADRTLFGAAPSWYTGANIAGKARGFLPYIGGFKNYIDHCEEIAAADYRGFVLSSR
ncbi:hypothetical protein [Microbacterium sp. Se5.02b]|uniref:hypothetical protein n=1 Tax=Microbacterium sp. Se5.02b TaxID=2864103 RepID=UPI001C68F2B8|nr:hypothetical protein [Microbacterium sp. Se5.02b]QYM63986.1 hypothetical protein K1X59_18035 [Microbacterium sp. Se5.02b]